MELLRVTADYELKQFDCGDEDLNEFLLNNAKDFARKKLANTFVIEEAGNIVAYFCLLNDKISKTDVAQAAWRRVKKKFPHEKHFSSYPTIKIGRFAVSKDYRGSGVGSRVMLFLKHKLYEDNTYSAYRFLTVDAYLSAVRFYEKNGFEPLLSHDENKHTRLMYFDLLRLQQSDL